MLGHFFINTFVIANSTKLSLRQWMFYWFKIVLQGGSACLFTKQTVVGVLRRGTHPPAHLGSVNSSRVRG